MSPPPERAPGWVRRAHPGVLVAAAVAAAAAGLVLLGDGNPAPTPGPPPAPESSKVAATAPRAAPLPPPSAITPVPAPAPSTGPPPAEPASPVPSAPDGADQGWREAATGFAAAFTAAPGPGQDWATGLMPWVSADLAAAYQGTDPTRLPTGTLLQVIADRESSYLVVATVSYDTGLQLAVELRPAPDTPTGWVVSTVLAIPS